MELVVRDLVPMSCDNDVRSLASSIAQSVDSCGVCVFRCLDNLSQRWLAQVVGGSTTIVGFQNEKKPFERSLWIKFALAEPQVV